MKIKKKTSHQQDVTFLVQKNEQDCATTTKVVQHMLCTFTVHNYTGMPFTWMLQFHKHLEFIKKHAQNKKL
jgi:hypothetical protein